jgi:cyanate permease
VRGHLWILIAAAVLIDMAVQTTLVFGPQMIYNLKPAARSRLNTLYIPTFFVGGAIGSAAASRAYEHL